MDDADGVPGGPIQAVNTGLNWSSNMYQTFRVDFSPSTYPITYWYDGALIYSAAAGICAGTAVEKVIHFGDNASTVGQSINFDNLNIVPAPGPAKLIAAVGLLMARRRRR